MKGKNILKMSILSGMVFSALAFTNLSQQKGKDDKGDKSQKQTSEKAKGQEQAEQKSDRSDDKVKSQPNQSSNDNGSKGDQKGKNKHENKSDDHGKSDKIGESDSFKSNRGNGNSRTLNGKRDSEIDWNLNDFGNRKHPKDQKKVTICHNPSGDGNNGVTINVSENALSAHLNHGDNRGSCNVDYSTRWSENYVKSRENVYNTYEQTFERMSYSEALLRVAAEKLLGIRSNLDRNRATLSTSEIQRREALMLDLQNNISALDSQVGATRQQLDSDVNIIISL